MKHLQQLSEQLGDLGPLPPESQLAQLSGYLEHLMSWTERMDLVSPGTSEQLIQRHIRDAYAGWLLLEARGLFAAGDCMDVGSGAGLPGVVFSILSPGSKFYLCEPRQKRVVFLQEARRRLELKNVIVVGKRLEDIEPNECPNVKLVSFRALRPEGELLETVRGLCPGAVVAFVTGSKERLELPGGVVSEEIDYSFCDDIAGRKIILLKSIP